MNDLISIPVLISYNLAILSTPPVTANSLLNATVVIELSWLNSLTNRSFFKSYNFATPLTPPVITYLSFIATEVML